MPKHASASLAVLDLVMASPAQPAARRSPRRPCLLSASSDGQPLPWSDQKGKLPEPGLGLSQMNPLQECIANSQLQGYVVAIAMG